MVYSLISYGQEKHNDEKISEICLADQNVCDDVTGDGTVSQSDDAITSSSHSKLSKHKDRRKESTLTNSDTSINQVKEK